MHIGGFIPNRHFGPDDTYPSRYIGCEQTTGRNLLPAGSHTVYESGPGLSQTCQEPPWERDCPLRIADIRNMIRKVIYNGDCTIVLWKDGTKTIVRCDSRDDYDEEKGLSMAIVKRISGNTGSYYEIFKEHCSDH